MNKPNLLALSDFLMKNEVPFLMGAWRAEEYGDMGWLDAPLTLDEIDQGLASCGTAGCALGWAPFVIPPTENCIIQPGEIHFPTYEKEAFDLTPMQSASVFESRWERVDDTREGAAFRLWALATHGTTYDPDGMVFSSQKHELREAYYADRDKWLAEQQTPTPTSN